MKFQDSTGNEYNIIINIGKALSVLESTGADLLNPLSKSDNDMPITQRLLYDDIYLAKVIASLVSDDSKEQARVLESLDGSSMKRAENAFWKEYRFFFEERGKKWASTAIQADLTTREANAQKALDELNQSATALFSNFQDVPES